MGVKRREKELKRRRKRNQRMRHSLTAATRFLDGVDTYRSELERLREKPIVRGLLGVFALTEDAYYTLDDESRLAMVGLSDHEMVYFDSEHDIDRRLHPESTATGCACALRTPCGSIRPIVFIRDNVHVSESDADDGTIDEVRSGFLTLVLLHELGHADDINKAINFTFNPKPQIDVVSAEVYAHKFVLHHAKARNYRLALRQYLREIEEHQAHSDDAPVRQAAIRVMEETNFEELKEWAERVWSEVPGGYEWRLAKSRHEETVAH